MTVECTRLKSGLTVVTQTMPHLESAALGVWIKSGSRNETEDEHGIAHLLEHMAFKGTARRTAREIAEEIEDVGGEVNAATSTETTSYYARVLKDHVPLAVDILADILTESAFDDDELQREKQVILQEINAANDTPDDGQQARASLRGGEALSRIPKIRTITRPEVARIRPAARRSHLPAGNRHEPVAPTKPAAPRGHLIGRG